MLDALDRHWKEHLVAMDYLRQGIHLRGYAQKNPEQEYKKEAYNLFVNMLGVIKSDVISKLSMVHIPTPEEIEAMKQQEQTHLQDMQLNFMHNDVEQLADDSIELEKTSEIVDEITPPESRNSPCPCGSGLKYKQCHGKI